MTELRSMHDVLEDEVEGDTWDDDIYGMQTGSDWGCSLFAVALACGVISTVCSVTTLILLVTR